MASGKEPEKEESSGSVKVWVVVNKGVKKEGSISRKMKK